MELKLIIFSSALILLVSALWLLSPPTASVNIVLAGDSMTAAKPYAAIWRRKLGSDYRVICKGEPGNRISDLRARTANINTAFDSSARYNLAVVWIGSNSLADGMSASEALAEVTDCIQALHAGAKWNRVVCVSVLPRAGGFNNGATRATFEEQRQVFNQGLVSTGANQVIDLDGVEAAQDPTNRHFYDEIGIHPKADLYAIFWPLLRTAIP